MADAPYSGGFATGDRFAVDGDFTVPSPIGEPRISYPFEGDSHAPSAKIAVLVQGNNPSGYKYQIQEQVDDGNFSVEAFVIEQDFQVAADFYGGIKLNTAYDVDSYAPDYAGSLNLALAVLVNESPTINEGNGLVKWTRTYATVPPTRNSYESYHFTFPGIGPTVVADPVDIVLVDLFPDGTLPQLSNGGPPVTTDVVARVEKKFFLLDSGGGSPIPFSPNPDDINSDFYIVPKFQVFFGTFFNEVTACADADLISLMTFKKVSDGSDAADIAQNTIPPANSDGVGNDGDSGDSYNDMLATVGGCEICVKQSIFRQWRGNIYERTTLYALAQ